MESKIKRFLMILIALSVLGCIFAKDAIETSGGKGINNPRGFPNDGGYSVLCYKCRDHSKRANGYYGCWGCPSWRRYDIPNKVVNGEKCMVYKCQHGHTLYLSVETNNRY